MGIVKWSRLTFTIWISFTVFLISTGVTLYRLDSNREDAKYDYQASGRSVSYLSRRMDCFYKDGRIRNAYQGGDLILPPGWTPSGRVPGFVITDQLDVNNLDFSTFRSFEEATLICSIDFNNDLYGIRGTVPASAPASLLEAVGE